MNQHSNNPFRLSSRSIDALLHAPWIRLDYDVWTESSLDTKEDSPHESWNEQLFVSHSAIVYVSDQDALRIWIDAATGCLTFADDVHKTVLQTDLPFAPTAFLTEVSRLRYAHTPFPAATAKAPSSSMLGDTDCTLQRIDVGEPVRAEIALWTTDHPLWDGPRLDGLMHALQAVMCVEFGDSAIAHLSTPSGMLVKSEMTIHKGPSSQRTIRQLASIDVAEGAPQNAMLDESFIQKQATTYDDLMARRVGAPPSTYTEDEAAVLKTVARFREGYLKRNIEDLPEWIEALFTEDVCVLGTDGAFPGTHEWRQGQTAAHEMFERDWRHWGDLRMYSDEALLSVTGDAAWIVLFATVTVDRGDCEASRQRCLARLSQYATHKQWPPQRALYECLADAANVLVQYERGKRFVWPLRIALGLTRVKNAWRIHFVDFSHPARGFRTWRLHEEVATDRFFR